VQTRFAYIYMYGCISVSHTLRFAAVITLLEAARLDSIRYCLERKGYAPPLDRTRTGRVLFLLACCSKVQSDKGLPNI